MWLSWCSWEIWSSRISKLYSTGWSSLAWLMNLFSTYSARSMVSEHQQHTSMFITWKICAHTWSLKLIKHNGMEIWGWGIYDLNGWGIYGLRRWVVSYGKVSYCFYGEYTKKSLQLLWLCFCPKIASEHLTLKCFWGAMYPTSLYVLYACMCIYRCTSSRHLCNHFSKLQWGYKPKYVSKQFWDSYTSLSTITKI